MTQFKVGDRVRTIRLHEGINRRSVGTILHVWDSNAKVQFDNGKTTAIPFTNLAPHKPRKAPTKSDISNLRQEIAIRNETIAKLNSDCLTYQSRIADLGDRLAHIQLQRESLKKQIEIVDAEHDAQITKLKDANHDAGRRLVVTEHENATLAIELMAWKAAAVIMSIFAIGIGAVLAFG